MICLRMLEEYPVQLVLATTLYCFFIRKKRQEWLKLFLFTLPMLLIYDYFLYRREPIQNIVLNKTLLMIPVVCTMVAVRFSLQCKWVEAFYSAIAGYATQNIVYNVYWIIKLWLVFEEGSPESIAISFILMIVIYTITYALFSRRLQSWDANSFNMIKLSANGFFVIFIASFLNTRVPETDLQYQIYVVYIFCDILALLVQFGLFHESELERKNMIVEQLLYEEQKQQKMTQETIEVINHKCHDLKHQIEALRSMDPGEERERYIGRIEEAVMIYNSAVKTGNKTLDLILMDKLLFCERHKIKISCIADGEKLCFIDTMDLYSLFGNAIDNAIESVMNEEDIQKRVISLRISCRGQLLVIHLENYIGNDLEFEGGLPITTKEDKRYHGFGTMSIRHIVKKYHGTLSIHLENHMFIMDMLLPVAAEIGQEGIVQ